jgi:IS30 family transposase
MVHYSHLRHQRKKYRKRYGSPARNGPIKDRVFIDERPKIVDEKSRIGDWEIDTIIGKGKTQAIITVVERRSKKLVCAKIPAKKAHLTKEATINALAPFTHSVLTITGDNGVEFAEHRAISKALNAQFYFAHPYSSWERGLNENTNGLVRQYFKKGSDFSHVTDHDLIITMDKLNNRPRKSLGYRTPNEIFGA